MNSSAFARELNKLFVTGEFLSVISGPNVIASGSFVSAEGDTLVIADFNGTVRFIHLGDAIGIIKIT